MKGSEDASPPRQKGNWWLPGAGGRRTTAYWAQCPLGGQHHVLKPDRDAACATLGMLSKWSFKRLNFVFNFVKLIVTSIKKYIYMVRRGSVVKNPPASAGDARDAGLIPGLGRSPRGGNGNPLQYSCLENPTDRGAWWATVHGVAKSQT